MTENISLFIDLLSEERSRDYNSWRDVGLALHNSGNVLDLWLQFSAKCTETYNEQDCIATWKSFKIPTQ